MTNNEKHMAKIIFKNKILEYNGQQFEDFFVDIMTRYNQDFRPVKAYGNIGDKKTMGLINEQEHIIKSLDRMI